MSAFFYLWLAKWSMSILFKSIIEALVLKGAAIALILFYAWYMHSSLSLVDDEFWFFYSIPGIRGMIVYFFLSVLLI